MKQKRFTQAFIAIAFLFCTTVFHLFSPAFADLLFKDPHKACSLLDEVGLATRGWKNDYGAEYGCSSPYKEIGSGFPLANNIAFYVDGDRSAAVILKLVLNVNDRTSAASAHRELVNNASKLTVRTTGKQLPQQLKTALENGGKASEKLGSSTLDVDREDWPSGKGYEVRFTIK